MRIDITSLDAMIAFGRRLGAALFPGAVVALVGPLGAGKTFLARAIAEGLGVTNARTVCSPTFALIHEYFGRLPVFHFDVYRLTSSAEFGDLGAEEYFASEGVCLIEWADRISDQLPADHLCIAIQPTGESTRRVHLSAGGPRHAELLDALK